MTNFDRHIAVGLSGGVDSSVAALLLKEQGYRVEAVFMKNWEEDDQDGYCAAAADLADARSIASALDIPLRTVNFSDSYWDRVFVHFLSEYRAGRTPNPDILCNREIKFRAFLDFALAQGAQGIATGHYARVDRVNGVFRLLKGRDAGKDQSYFLYTLGQRQLERSRFPVGELNKAQVRRIALEHGLVTHDKKDSTGICFIGERRFREFLKRFLPARPGEMRTTEGRVVGQHEGLMYYTIGQRQGLGIGGLREADDRPWYVLGKELETNTLIVGQGHDHPLLFTDALEASLLSWVAGSPPARTFSCRAKTRYRQSEQPCTVHRLGDDRCEVLFQTPQRAVTPGQSIVFYDGEVCLGGGIIDRAWRQAG